MLAPTMLRLSIQPPQGESFERRVEGESVVLGRGLDCDLSIADPFLSRRHARLVAGDSGWRIEDLGSRNGTRVNGELVEGLRPVGAGDVIEISGCRIEVLGGGSSSSVRPERADLSPDATYFRSAAELLESQTGEIAADEDELRRWAERLSVVNEVHRDLGRPLSLPELLERTLDRVFDHLQPERGVIYLRREDGTFEPAAHRAKAGAGEILHSTSLLREVAENGLAALVFDVESDERFAEAKSMLDFGVRSLVAAPLLDAEGSLGMIALDSRLPVRQFREVDMEMLVSIASAAALRIRNLALAEEAAERRRLQTELDLARRIQVALLPEDLPEPEGWSIYGGNLPSRGVSGDFYEVVERESAEGRLEVVLLIADVSGKGMAASLLTASLEALLAPHVEAGLPPEEIATRASHLLYRRTPPEKYATVFLAALDPETGRVRYACAGHNPALLLRADGEVERLVATGPPLGLLPLATYRPAETALEPGSVLVLYTDGFVEAEDPDGEEYGIDRLETVCREHRTGPPADLAEAIESDVERYARGVPIADDRTLVIARREGGSG